MTDARTDFSTLLPNKISGNPDLAKAIDAVFVFKITGEGGGTWTIDCKNNLGVREGEETADCTLEVSAEDWKKIGENPGFVMQLYFLGKLKISGNAMLATKLQQILG